MSEEEDQLGSFPGGRNCYIISTPAQTPPRRLQVRFLDGVLREEMQPSDHIQARRQLLGREVIGAGEFTRRREVSEFREASQGSGECASVRNREVAQPTDQNQGRVELRGREGEHVEFPPRDEEKGSVFKREETLLTDQIQTSHIR